ncbi:MAG: hypothetical protein ABIX28_16740 [Vicinamibacterales bacterium]
MRIRAWTSVCAAVLVASVGSSVATGAEQRPATIEERATGAERVVVASVDDVTASYESNAHGDRLIVSHARLRVHEALKGPADPITLDYEGGTVDGITLHVSSLPVLQRGQRAVFFVTRGPKGELTPHLRGQGILKLDAGDRVPNSSLTLDDLRRMVGHAR